MTKPTPNKKALIGRVVIVVGGKHAGRQGVVLWIDDSQVRLQTSTSLITVNLDDLEIDHDI